MGTADYMAPEQATDSHQADTRSDIYSLGCTLFHLLTGRVPFPGGTALDKVMRHAAEPLPDAARLRRDLPSGLAAVLRRMTAKSPADRFQTPGEVAQALAPFAAPPLRRRRRVAVLALLALLVLAACVAGIVYLSRPRPADPTKPSAAKPFPGPLVAPGAPSPADALEARQDAAASAGAGRRRRPEARPRRAGRRPWRRAPPLLRPARLPRLRPRRQDIGRAQRQRHPPFRRWNGPISAPPFSATPAAFIAPPSARTARRWPPSATTAKSKFGSCRAGGRSPARWGLGRRTPVWPSSPIPPVPCSVSAAPASPGCGTSPATGRSSTWGAARSCSVPSRPTLTVPSSRPHRRPGPYLYGTPRPAS